jgi:hypothetical protein
MSSFVPRVVQLALIVTLAGCHWIFQYQSAPDARGRQRDVGIETRDASVDVRDAPMDAPVPRDGKVVVDAPWCSPTGVPTGCDPFLPSSCAVGSCYLTKDQGPACVCEAGVMTIGEQCQTTPNCTPESVCAGKRPPGECRPLCNTRTPWSDCRRARWGGRCTTIEEFDPYGYCGEEVPLPSGG